jgi:aldehyde dehydrogenase (NAD+)
MLEGRRAHFIGGAWREPAEGAWFPTYDPADGSVLAEVARGGEADVAAAVAAARAAFPAWADRFGAERGRILWDIARRIRAEAEALAALETRNTGKPLRQARADVEVAARYFEFYAGAADKWGGRTIPVPGPFLDYTLREPLGVCAEIIPWNYPLQIGARAIAAPLAVGNTVVLKPAEEAPLTVLELARIAAEAGVPPGVLNVVAGYGPEAGAALARNPGIDHLTFTGSVEVGREVMAAAARNIVPVLLELGGKSPNVVFPSADLERAIPIIANAVVQNAGQTCSAGSRLLVHRTVHDEVVERLAAHFRRLSVGPGLADPDVGPLISAAQYARVRGFLEQAEREGVRVRADTPVPAAGWFVPPTVLDGVAPASVLFREEIFGPVVAVTPFADEEEAVRLANGTPYGLVAAVWTRDLGQGHRVARRIRAGQVFLNAYGAGGGVEMPFGGFGQSGFGRQKGLEALEHYTQVKNVAVWWGD